MVQESIYTEKQTKKTLKCLYYKKKRKKKKKIPLVETVKLSMRVQSWVLIVEFLQWERSIIYFRGYKYVGMGVLYRSSYPWGKQPVKLVK